MEEYICFVGDQPWPRRTHETEGRLPSIQTHTTTPEQTRSETSTNPTTRAKQARLQVQRQVAQRQHTRQNNNAPNQNNLNIHMHRDTNLNFGPRHRSQTWTNLKFRPIYWSQTWFNLINNFRRLQLANSPKPNLAEDLPTARGRQERPEERHFHSNRRSDGL